METTTQRLNGQTGSLRAVLDRTRLTKKLADSPEEMAETFVGNVASTGAKWYARGDNERAERFSELSRAISRRLFKADTETA
jgi:hypothetical protein